MQHLWQFIKDHAWMPFFLLANVVGVLMIPLGLPGIWVQFLAALLVTAVTKWIGAPHLGWGWTGAILMIALAGEFVDFVMGNLGFKSTQGSSRAEWYSFAGGFLFAMLGFLVPVPLIGSIVMSFVGTFVGAIYGEISHQKRLAAKAQDIEKKSHMKPALRVATGAIIGRACGIAAKLWFAIVAFFVAVVGLILS